MRILLTAALATVLVLDVSEVRAAGSLERSLLKLDPIERAHQACVIKGLDAIRRGDKRLAKADRLMPDTFKRANLTGNVVSAKGAAVRANEHWYAISFECTVSDNQLKALAFTFKVGEEIPPDKWEEAGLWR